MSTCQTEIRKVQNGFDLNLFMAEPDEVSKLSDIVYLEEQYLKMIDTPFIIKTDIGDIKAGNIRNAKPGRWYSRVKGVTSTCALMVEDNPVLQYLHDKKIRLAGSVIMNGSLEIFVHIDRLGNIHKDYNLNDIPKE